MRKVYEINSREIALEMTNPNLLDDALRNDPEYLLGEHTNSTIVAGRRDIMAFEAGDTSERCYGVAFDVGTNTIVGSLVDLVTGREIGAVSAVNPQVTHGDDVVSRIRFAKSAGGLDLMRHEVGNAMNGLLEAMLKKFKIEGRLVYVCTAVGNTVMQHILVGVSPEGLGRAPYRAKLMSAVDTVASRTGLEGHHACRLFGLDHLAVSSKQGFCDAVRASLASSGVQVVEVQTERGVNHREHQRLWQAAAAATSGAFR